MANQRQGDRKLMQSGRRRKRRDLEKESHWRKHVAAQKESGLAVRVYCQNESLSEACFHWWRREIVKRDREAKVSRLQQPTPARFAEIHVIGETSIDGATQEACCAGSFQPTDAPKPDPIDKPQHDPHCTPRTDATAELPSDSTAAAAGVEVVLGGGRRLRVFPDFDEPTLLRVVALLEGVRPC